MTSPIAVSDVIGGSTMTPGYYRLELYRGDTRRWRFRLWQDLDMTEPLDLAGVVAHAEIRDQACCAGTVVPLTCTVEAPNEILVVLPHQRSMQLPCGWPMWNGAWDLQLVWPDQDVMTVIAGDVRVTPNVTASVTPTTRSQDFRGLRAVS